MGCCISLQKPTIYEVTLDDNGVAHRVRSGQGTHLIYVSKDKETHMEKKNSPQSPSSSPTAADEYLPVIPMSLTLPPKVHPQEK
ncbi:hypothetical protein BDF14DRAFT_1884319 [Spinellus fusiger]|nr:hypothetical protein BDF14DRAFT_1884319 [Spinellus fusiger]